MSILIIKDEINTSAAKQAKNIISFLGRKDLKSFTQKRKISNTVQSLFIDFLESKREEIIPKRKRKRVFFADDVTLPSNEVSSLVTQTIEHIVEEEEYVEIMKYKDCYKNEDFLNGMKRRDEEQQQKEETIEELLLTLPEAVEDIINQEVHHMKHAEKLTKVIDELNTNFHYCCRCNTKKYDKYYEGNGPEYHYDFYCQALECEDDGSDDGIITFGEEHYGGAYDTRYEDPEHEDYDPSFGYWD